MISSISQKCIEIIGIEHSSVKQRFGDLHDVGPTLFNNLVCALFAPNKKAVGERLLFLVEFDQAIGAKFCDVYAARSAR